jgi:hypothetical protein
LSEPRPIIKEQLDRSIEEAIEGITRIKDVFDNPAYDLNTTVENELDFLLGALFGTIVAINYVHLKKLRLKPTAEENLWINRYMFSRAREFKDAIRNRLQL